MCYVKSSIPFKIWPLQNDDLETLWLTVRPRKPLRQFSMLTLSVLFQPPEDKYRVIIAHVESGLNAILCEHPRVGICNYGGL